MKVMICGSRDIDDFETLVKAIKYSEYPVTEVISGGARGVDSMAQYWALGAGIPFKLFKPDWDKHGKSAGFKRNVEMVDACDAVIAIWDGESRGTKHSIDYARKQGKEVLVVTVKEVIKRDYTRYLGK